MRYVCQHGDLTQVKKEQLRLPSWDEKTLHGLSEPVRAEIVIIQVVIFQTSIENFSMHQISDLVDSFQIYK